MQIRVNPVDCKAHGLCAELLPEWIELDEWGYPVLDGAQLPAHLLAEAKRAAKACPTLALRLTAEAPDAAAGRPPKPSAYRKVFPRT